MGVDSSKVNPNNAHNTHLTTQKLLIKLTIRYPNKLKPLNPLYRSHQNSSSNNRRSPSSSNNNTFWENDPDFYGVRRSHRVRTSNYIRPPTLVPQVHFESKYQSDKRSPTKSGSRNKHHKNKKNLARTNRRINSLSDDQSHGSQDGSCGSEDDSGSDSRHKRLGFKDKLILNARN